MDRLGILLGVAVGFLLAPELIGQDRLERLESAVERWSRVQ